MPAPQAHDWRDRFNRGMTWAGMIESLANAFADGDAKFVAEHVFRAGD